MKDKLPEHLFTELRKYLLANLGLNFTDNREKDLVRKIGLVAKEFNFTDTYKFILWLLNTNLTNKQIEILASYLTVGETYFLREKEGLDFLEQKYLPELIYKRRGKDQHLRIWSAGCASGEEPYSIAIMLLRAIPDIKNWDITILATDINPTFVNKAKKGIYTTWSFRNNPKWLINNYFNKVEDNKFRILPGIKKMVTFSYYNLAKDIYPSLTNNTNAMDIIFCRNVLIYFSQKGIKDVTRRLYNSLVNGGILLVSPVEMSNLISPEFSRIYYSGRTIYQKNTKKVKQKEIPEWEISTPIKTQKSFPQVPKIEIVKPVFKPAETKPENKVKEDQTLKISGYEKAVNLFKQGSFEEAESILTNILTKDKEGFKSIISLLAKTKANLGKLDESGSLCKKALETNILDTGMYFLMATILQEQGKDKEAISLLNRALYLEPDFALASFFLGNLTMKSGENTTSLKHFKNTLNILAKLNPEEILPQSDGMTAGRLAEIISAIKGV